MRYLPVMAAVLMTAAAAQELPANVAAVRSYILAKDYPEVFGDSHYKTRIENVVTADLDGDGYDEVIVHYAPHYRQSAPIVIYRVAADLSVTRVTEGLAPGPLVPLSGDYLDSHTVGDAADFDIADQQGDAGARQKVVETALKQGSSIVAYANFFHFDGRKGASYIDMTALEAPPAKKTCEDFEFSKVNELGAGSVDGLGRGDVLAAWAGSAVYLYRINRFLPSGLLDKSLWKVDVAADFRGFTAGSRGPLKYRTASGETRAFAVACKDATHCRLKN